MTVAPTRVSTHPVVEVFGPTIQGEGAMAGLPTYFVRMGGCDWRCSWCDSLHAVEPALVRQAPKLTDAQIIEQLGPEPLRADWVTLSGGNPALHELSALVEELRERDLHIAVETQGSRWRDWLASVDHLTVSPKPPSSGEATERNVQLVSRFMQTVRASGVTASLKIVVFDEIDLDWALYTAEAYDWLPFYLSCGTNSQGREPLEATAERYRWLCEAVTAAGCIDSARRARVIPQLHVIAWGHRLGV